MKPNQTLTALCTVGCVETQMLTNANETWLKFWRSGLWLAILIIPSILSNYGKVCCFTFREQIVQTPLLPLHVHLK